MGSRLAHFFYHTQQESYVECVSALIVVERTTTDPVSAKTVANPLTRHQRAEYPLQGHPRPWHFSTPIPGQSGVGPLSSDITGILASTGTDLSFNLLYNA